MEESQSTTIRCQTPTESLARSSWVEIEWIDPVGLPAEAWVRYGQILKKVTEPAAELDVVSLLRDVKLANSALLAILDSERTLVGAIIVKVLDFDSGYRALLVQVCATEGTRICASNWREIMAGIERLAEFSKCDSVRVLGRRGWARILPEYTEVARVFDKVIRRDD